MAVRKMSTSALKAEIARREKGAGKLRRERDKVAAQLDKIDAKLAELEDGGARRGPGRPKKATTNGRRGKKKTGRRKATGRKATGKKTGRRRAKNDMSLAEAIVQAVEKGAVVSPKEASALVKANGYKSSSPNFGMMVANSLAKDKRFKRKGRGEYERVK